MGATSYKKIAIFFHPQ